MVIVGFHPQELAEEEVIKVKEDVKQFFMEGEGSKLKVNSLYFQFLSRRLEYVFI